MDAAPKSEDFIVTRSTDGGEASNVTPNDVTLDLTEKEVTFTVAPVVATAADQSVVYSVSYKGGTMVVATTPVIVAADEELAAQALAENAVTAYEAAVILTYTDVALTTELKVAADSAVTAVTDVTVNDELEGRVTAKATTISTQLAAVVKAVNDADTAGNQIQLLQALAFFNDVNAQLISAYTTELTTETSVIDIQDAINTVNSAITDTAAVLAVNEATNQIGLLAALKDGQTKGVFTNVRDQYIVEYDAALDGSQNKAGIQAALDGAVNNVVNTADASVKTAQTTPNESNIAAAQTKVDLVPVDVIKTAAMDDASGLVDDELVTVQLNLFLEALRPVAAVQKVLTGTEAELIAALNSSVFSRVNETSIAAYKAEIAVTDITIELIQTAIDTANVSVATGAVDAAKETLLTSGKVATAQALVTALPADVTGTTKADLQKALDVVNALLAVDVATTQTATTLLSALQSHATVLSLTVANSAVVNPLFASAYLTAFTVGDQTTRDTAEEIQAMVVTVNSPVAALGTLRNEAALGSPTATDSAFLALIKADSLNLQNVLTTNAQAYNSTEARAAFTNAITVTTALVTDVAKVQKVINYLNSLETIKVATTIQGVSEQINNIAITYSNEDWSSYLDLDDVQQLEIATMVKESALEPGDAASYKIDGFNTFIGDLITDQSDTLTAINGVVYNASNTDYLTLISGFDFSEFDTLSGSQQLAVAQKVKAAHPVSIDTDGATVNKNWDNYTQFKSAVFTAISAAQ